MPVVLALAEGPRRFSELRDALEGVSPRALALALKDLEAAGLVDRGSQTTIRRQPSTG